MNNLKSTQSNNKKTRRKKKKSVLFLLFQIKLCQNQTLRERERKKKKTAQIWNRIKATA
jgi:hypothetical protein